MNGHFYLRGSEVWVDSPETCTKALVMTRVEKAGRPKLPIRRWRQCGRRWSLWGIPCLGLWRFLPIGFQVSVFDLVH